jgi:hypothetical protein
MEETSVRIAATKALLLSLYNASGLLHITDFCNGMLVLQERTILWISTLASMADAGMADFLTINDLNNKILLNLVQWARKPRPPMQYDLAAMRASIQIIRSVPEPPPTLAVLRKLLAELHKVVVTVEVKPETL